MAFMQEHAGGALDINAIAVDGRRSARATVVAHACVVGVPFLRPEDRARRPMSCTSLLTTPAGVPARAHIPYQMGKLKPARPASAIVGTSGINDERRALLTPRARSLPSRI